MKLDKLQKKAGEMADYNEGPIKGLIEAIWVGEEGVETMREFRKAMKRNAPLDEKALQEEMGDTLIALCHLANRMGYDLNDIAQAGLDKLEAKLTED